MRLLAEMRCVGTLRFFFLPLFLLAGVGAFGEGEKAAVWQVSLRYDESGEWELLEAELAPEAKLGSVDSGGRAVATDWQWLDSEGASVYESVAYLPLRVSVPLAESGPSSVGWIEPERGIVTARVLGPESEEGISSVRISPRGERDALRMGEQARTLAMPEERMSLFEDDGTGPSGSYLLRDTGADSHRLVFVIVGDGYSQEDIESGLYREHAERTLAAFEAVAPWDILLQGTNVYVVNVVSAERGASREDGADGAIKDTYFQTSFYFGGLERVLYPEGDGVKRAREAADEAVGIGAWDQVLMMVNSSKYGGSGGSVAVHSMGVNGPRASVHEVGHSFAGLADEYGYGNDEAWSSSRPSEPNVDTDLENLKWKVWLEDGVPLPTPDSPEWKDRVGAFEGAKYKDFGVYRPQRTCLMRELGSDFCKVCVERHIQRYFELVLNRLNAEPARHSMLDFVGPRTFSLDVPPIEGVEAQWFLGDELIEGAREFSYTVNLDDFSQDRFELSVELSFDESVVRNSLLGRVLLDVVRRFETPLGTPYRWLERYGLGTVDGVDEIDHDGDGFSTAEEYRLWTDPTDYQSRLRLHLEKRDDAAAAIRLTWNFDHFETDGLERSTDMVHWEAVPSDEIHWAWHLGYLYHEIPNAEGVAYFYRLMVRPGE